MKFWLIIAGSLLIFGLVMFVIVMSINGWDFSNLGASRLITNTHEIENSFNSISINTTTADISILPSTDGACRVECYELEKAKHSVSVKDDTLCVELDDERAWYDMINFNPDSPKITLFLPFKEYGSLVINDTTGDLEVCNNLAFGSVDISLTTGDITLSDIQCDGNININLTTGKTQMTNVQCKNLVSKGSTGDLKLENVLCQEKLYAKRTTGDIELDGCDGGEIEFDLTTGDVEGTILSDKVFITRTSTGDIDVPESITGGKCKITTTTGDINIKIKK
jgi:DUF4097 and DUF4098 domain-containing protein YvlB